MRAWLQVGGRGQMSGMTRVMASEWRDGTWSGTDQIEWRGL